MRSPVLVSRDVERARLQQALARAAEGRGGVWVLRGDPGIGKSRLAGAVAEDAARSGLEVLSGRAVRSATPTSLRPLGEALLGMLRDRGVPDDRHLAPYLPALARLAPQLGPVTDDGAPSDMLIGEGLLRLARAVDAPAMLLLVEDLHWADPETLGVLEYLADNVRDVPLLVVATARADESPGVSETLTALSSRHAAEVVDIPPLAGHEVAELVRVCLDAEPPAEVVAWVERFSGGFPLLIEEMLADLRDAGALVPDQGGWSLSTELSLVVPRTFARSVESRLEQVSDTAREVVAAAAMLGSEFDWRVVAAASGLQQRAVADALRELRAQRLVDVAGDGFSFRHALTREAVLAGLLAPDRARLAASLAAALAELGAPAASAGEAHRQLAELFEAAGDDRAAAEHWFATARAAVSSGALTSALDALRRALQRVTPGSSLELDVREAEVEVHAMAGDVPRALAAGERLLVELSDDSGRLAAVRLRLARALLAGGRWAEAAHMLEAAAGHDPAVEQVLAARLALGQRDPGLAEERARSALAAVGPDRPEVACEAWEVLGRAARCSDFVVAEEAFEAGFRLAEEQALPLWRCRLLSTLGALDLAGRRPTEDRLLTARASALEVGAIATAARAELDLNLVRIRYFELDRVMASVDPVLGILHRLRLPDLGAAYLIRASAHGLAGRAEQMETDIALALQEEREPGQYDVAIAGLVRAFVDLGNARYAEARSHLADAVAAHRLRPSLPFSLRGFWALLETVLTGDGEAARLEIRHGPQANNPHNAFALRYADAVALGQAGRGEEAARVFADAEWTVPGREPWPELHARLLVATAAAQDGWGEPEAWFRHALDGLVAYGQTDAASACRVAMRDAGFAVPRKAAGGRQVPAHLQRVGVTAREYDVLLLVAEGLQNKQVADRLYLSVRTVETHVARLLQRTGSADRSDLVAHLHDRGVRDRSRGTSRARDR